jgi:hypothetical protein
MIGGSPIPMYSSPHGMPYGVPYGAAPQQSYLPTPPYPGQFAPPAPPAPMPRQFAGNPSPPAPLVGSSGWQSGPPQSLPPTLATQAAGQQQPKLRGSIPDAPPPASRPAAPIPIRLPSPTELGLATPTAPALSLPSPTDLGLAIPTTMANAGHR